MVVCTKEKLQTLLERDCKVRSQAPLSHAGEFTEFPRVLLLGQQKRTIQTVAPHQQQSFIYERDFTKVLILRVVSAVGSA
jgi:hypothetical protein